MVQIVSILIRQNHNSIIYQLVVNFLIESVIALQLGDRPSKPLNIVLLWLDGLIENVYYKVLLGGKVWAQNLSD